MAERIRGGGGGKTRVSGCRRTLTWKIGNLVEAHWRVREYESLRIYRARAWQEEDSFRALHHRNRPALMVTVAAKIPMVR